MKKIIFLLALSIGIVSCEKEEEFETIEQTTDTELSIEKEILSFKDWDGFHQKYSEYSKISDLTELESISLYKIDEDVRKYSPALQGIINEDNQFKVNGVIIELNDGVFNQITEENGKMKAENVGSVNISSVPVDLDESNQTELNEKVRHLSPYKSDLYEVKEFRQKEYINCQNGVNHGSAPRTFRYLNQVHAEYIVAGTQQTYTLALRLYLEYNHRRNSWRLSGENREISVNINDNSRLISTPRGTIFPDTSGNPGNYNLSFNNSCSSHRIFPLREFSAPRTFTPPLLPGNSLVWSVIINGNITQKLTGNNEEWRHRIQY